MFSLLVLIYNVLMLKAFMTVLKEDPTGEHTFVGTGWLFIITIPVDAFLIYKLILHI